MKLWLDDVRPAPDDSWLWVTTVDEAKDVFRDYTVRIASLDHDLGHVAAPDSPEPRDPDEMTLDDYLIARSRPGADGIDLVKWMVEVGAYPSEAIIIHSWNPAGAENMRATLERAHCQCPVTVAPFKLPARLNARFAH